MNLLFEELIGSHGARIGIASLDAEQTLNALSLPMINALHERLDAWARDPHIACVLLRGHGAKAFCAGGEVRSLAEACRAHPGKVPTLAADFFAAEYRLDYALHTYPKPLVCWGHGYVLGGGMGLLQGASIRIVTPVASWQCRKSASACIRMWAAAGSCPAYPASWDCSSA